MIPAIFPIRYCTFTHCINLFCVSKISFHWFVKIHDKEFKRKHLNMMVKCVRQKILIIIKLKTKFDNIRVPLHSTKF